MSPDRASLPAAVDVFMARRRLRARLEPTALRASEWLSAEARADVRLKLEVIQPTGSFKIRGALNALLALDEVLDPNDARQVIAASAGNHGRALALAARAAGWTATIFAPASAPEAKKGAIRALGATLHDEFENYDEAERAARAASQRDGIRYVSPYNDPQVIAGAGTIGLEVAEALPDVDIVVVPLGGGGLASGIGLALEAALPHTRIVGVEVEASSPFTASRAAGRIVRIDPRPTLADGLTGNLEPGTITFPLVQRLVDEIVVVTEEELRRAMTGLLAEEHLVVEAAGAAATAAVLAARIDVKDRRVAVLATGANVDCHVLRSLLAAD